MVSQEALVIRLAACAETEIALPETVQVCAAAFHCIVRQYPVLRASRTSVEGNLMAGAVAAPADLFIG